MRFTRFLPAWALLLAIAPALAAGGPLERPAEIKIAVAPDPVAPGATATVTVELHPIAGVKINRYPKITLAVPATAGLVGEGRAELGQGTPPPPDRMDSNYFERIDPLELTLPVDGAARTGKHSVEGRLTYFYCVAASGFCAPKRTSVTIPLTVR